MKLTRILALLLALMLALSACTKEDTNVPAQTDAPAATDAGDTDDPTEEPTAETSLLPGGLRAAASYDAIYEMIPEEMWEDGFVTICEDDTTAEIAAEATSDAAESSYSDTNVQVDGVDEGDLVKTDGTYLYYLRDSTQLGILRADGAQTEQLSNIFVCESSADYDYYEYADSFYLYGDRVAVVYWRDDWSSSSLGEVYGVRIYDVSDRTAPTLVADVAQDGWSGQSRAADGIVYLASNTVVYGDPDPSDPATFVPCLYENGTTEAVPCDRIYLPETADRPQYLVVQSISLDTGAVLDTLCVLGGGSEIYMTADDLYVTKTVHTLTDGASYEDEHGNTVTPQTDVNETSLLRIAIDNGTLALAASGTVPGSLLSSYSMDEYDGYLRLVVTVSESTYTTTVSGDGETGVTSYQMGDTTTTNALYVLDDTLNVVGSITGLAEDERVYSARFDGAVGYFVTFRETDPLFSVDLSDPTAPAITGALHLPGFSSYLHVWTDDQLLGIGEQADEQTGATEGLKLALYDTSDPTDMVELVTVAVDGDYSPALDEPHAVYAEPSRGLVGFATTDWESSQYLLYSTEGGSLTLLGSYPLDDWIYATRTVRLGDELYVMNFNAGEMIVIDLTTAAETARLAIAAG